MLNIEKVIRGHETAESRWARFGPYYAMFPVEFAFDVVEKYSKENDYIIDPFAGRFSSIFAGSFLKRNSTGIEINPIGWLYGSVKVNPANKNKVINRLYEIYNKRNYYSKMAENLPEFYLLCFSLEVRKFLLSARKNLNWKKSKTDATLMSILLVYLQGKVGEGISNQLKMTKSMGMNYCLNWWKKNNFNNPPEIDIINFFLKKIDWRYEKGKPHLDKANIIFGNSLKELPKIIRKSNENKLKYSLLFTSPPYCSVTDYHIDQWLRMWLLGGSEFPKALDEKYKGRFINREEYHNLLEKVFNLSSLLMKRKSVIYVRTDYRSFTYETTLNVLKKNFPKHDYEIFERPLENKKSQTELFGFKPEKKCEIDIVMSK